ncbi:MAG: hypothetical protein ACHQF4_00915 [Sphingobacteriales bacterium]
MLHLITPLYHYDLLEKVYRTIPEHDDITWHISVSNRRERVPYDFVYTDPRIKLYELDCPDNDPVIKRNVVFDTIKDGYFYLLDDDTIFLTELYGLYKKTDALGFIGMTIGSQIHYRYKGYIKHAVYPRVHPYIADIDSGMVLSHNSVLSKVKWEWSIEQRDFDFWYRCYLYFGDEHTTITNTVFSVYNALGIIKIDKRFLFVKIKFNITNYRIARGYIAIRSFLRRLKVIKAG